MGNAYLMGVLPIAEATPPVLLLLFIFFFILPCLENHVVCDRSVLFQDLIRKVPVIKLVEGNSFSI